MIAAVLAAAVSFPRPAVAPERLALARETTEARLSPDGERLAFITDISGALEVWTVPSAGGWPTQLTALGEQASSLSWSPDGRWLLFASDFGGDERADLYRAPAGGGPVENLTASKQAETSPSFSPDGGRIAYTADPTREFLYELMVMDLETRHARRLTREAVNVHRPVWSPDGAAIAVTRSGDDQKGELLLVDVSSPSPRVIPAPEPGGIIFADDFSANGKTLLCTARNRQGFMQLYLLDLPSGEGRFVGPADWDVSEARFHPRAGIIFSRNEGGATALYRLNGPRDADRLLPARGVIESLSLDASGRRAAFVWSDSSRPRDAWGVDLKKRKPFQITDSLAAGVEPGELARGEFIYYPSFDERQIAALLLEPPHKRLGNPPPLVVEAHGGPDWQSFDDFQPLRQALAEAGFAVLAPNYRGSAGYGQEFLDANNKDWGGADLEDLNAGVRYLAEKGKIDPKRVGITGRSYGGYLTLTALTKSSGVYHAGVNAYGMPDLVQDYEMGASRFADWYETEMGSPKTHAQLFRDRSPVHFLDRLRAPLLILQGANDTNVPRQQSDLLYERLQRLGREAELVVYPDEGHGFTKRKNRADYYRRAVDFFRRHLGPVRKK